MAVCMAISCNKVAPDVAGDLIDVTFKVSTMSVTNEPITRASTPAADVLKQIYFRVLNSAGTEIGSGFQYESTAGFGTITMRTPAGSYSVFIWGSTSTSGGTNDGSDAIITNGADIFYFNSTVAVSDGQNNVDVVLERQTGRVTFDILDNKPADVGSIKITVSGFDRWRYSNNEFTKTQSATRTFTPTPNSSGGYDSFWTAYFPGSWAYNSLTFELLDAAGKSLGSVDIDIDIYKNRNTIVRGNLFDAISGKGFQILVNDDWGDDNVVPIG